MDVVQAVSGYLSKMVSVGDSASGTPSAKMKILLLDSETVSQNVTKLKVSRLNIK
jgi:vacuolar protein sorting-associated protein 45